MLHRERERQTDRQTDRQRDRERETERDRETERETERQTETERQRETDRQTHTHTDTHTHTQTHSLSLSLFRPLSQPLSQPLPPPPTCPRALQIKYAQEVLPGRTSNSGSDGDVLTSSEWLIMVVLTLVTSALSQAMFTLQMQFYCKISDPAIGGTYMTFLNTLTNLGGIWPTTSLMWLVGQLTDCSQDMSTSECAGRKDRYDERGGEKGEGRGIERERDRKNGREIEGWRDGERGAHSHSDCCIHVLAHTHTHTHARSFTAQVLLGCPWPLGTW